MRKTPKIYTDGSLLPGRAPGLQSSGKGLDSRARHGETLLESNHPSDVLEHAPVSLWVEDFSEIKRRGFLQISEKTLETHRLADLVRFALAAGLSP